MKQTSALGILQQGHNVFLTGPAGSGKTYVINQYVDWLRRHGIEPAITASTGIAATHIGGTTIHSWSGMGIEECMTPSLLDELLEKEHLWKRIGKAQVLIIDEISMITPALLDGVDMICRAIRQTPDHAFGGIQIVMCGDFFQLPPVRKRTGSQQSENQDVKVKRYAWQSQAWLDAAVRVCYLDEQYRQDSSDGLFRLLNDIRSGDATEDSLSDLRERFNVQPEGDVDPIRLYTHNADVDSININELEKLDGYPHMYEATTTGSKKNIEILDRGCLAHMHLVLKEGARVIFVKNNYERGYVNGTLGVVVGFDDNTDYPIVELYSGGTVMAAPDHWDLDQDGKTVARISQIPLRLAWAITIHKSQGMSLDAAVIDLSKCFEVGQGYVALSRVRSMDGLFLEGFNAQATQMDPLTMRVDARFRELSEDHDTMYQNLSDEEKLEKQEEFIVRSGGSLEETDYVSERDKELESTYEKTRKLLEQHKNLEQIAQERSLTVGTVIGHVSALQRQGVVVDTDHLERDQDIIDSVEEAYVELVESSKDDLYAADGSLKLKPLFTMLDGEISYDDIKYALLFIDQSKK